MKKYRTLRSYDAAYTRLERMARHFDTTIIDIIDQLSKHGEKHGKEFIQ